MKARSLGCVVRIVVTLALVLGAIDAAASAAAPLVDVSAVVARVLPAVVSITTRHIHEGRDRTPILRRGRGSGVIVERRGYIVTNHHVIEDAEQIKVTLPDERVFVARLVGSDRVTDLAVIKIDGVKLPVAAFGDSSRIRVGEPVIAIGNPLWIEGGPTVTAGVVSGLERTLEQPGLPMLHHLIQTDAAINEGNSGGPLVNRAGRVVGINTAIIASAHGIGFAIPIATVEPVLRELMAGRQIVRASLGVVAVSVTPQVAFANELKVERGALVTEVDADGPAATAGIRVGDVITRFDGVSVRDLQSFHAALWRKRPGDAVDVGLGRDGDAVTVRAVLGIDRGKTASE
jgi:serine protease Do